MREGDGIEEIDHPSFKDPEYVKRRWEIAAASLKYNVGDPEIPRIDYNENENWVWSYCYPQIRALQRTNCCKETNFALDDMEDKVPGYGPTQIP
jgi:hypothetical protein